MWTSTNQGGKIYGGDVPAIKEKQPLALQIIDNGFVYWDSSQPLGCALCLSNSVSFHFFLLGIGPCPCLTFKMRSALMQHTCNAFASAGFPADVVCGDLVVLSSGPALE